MTPARAESQAGATGGAGAFHGEVVLASAGTGKTFLLAHRMISHLMREDDPLIATGLATAALNLLYSRSRGVSKDRP